jgi:hypothetical protein
VRYIFKRSFYLSTILFFTFSSIFSTVCATEITVFGPKQYDRTTKGPDLYEHTFSAVPGEGRVIVNNGTQADGNRIDKAVSSAVIVLNGEQIFGPSDFNQKVHLLVAPVNLSYNNSLSVELAGSPGSYLTIRVVQEGVQLPNVTISASPMTIMYGESSTLTWNSTNADSCIIEPDIGVVDTSGSITVSPATTTTYTITALNPGGSATASATITVIYPQPTVSISANPETIQIGGSSTITWSSTNAVSCTIEPGIGTVDKNGSIIVSPTATTTYTITATGPGGITTDNVTVIVTYPTPIVTISADPETINIGNSSTLTWSSSYAVYISIDQGIGPVDPSGSINVSPTETTTYTITASNPMESVTESVTITVIPFGVTITSPLNNDLISRPDVMVEGTITNPLGYEVGVNVNGVVALVEAGHFAANHVPLEEGTNTITATIVDMEGNTASSSIAVYADTMGDYIRITADEESGVSLFETILRIDASFALTQEPNIAYTGPGVIDIVKIGDEYNYTITASTIGLYYITVEAEHEGYAYSDTIAILLMDEAVLDALLQAKWNGMKTALVNGDMDGVIDYIAEHRKEMYEYNLDLMSSYLSEISAGLENIALVQINDRMAEYEMWSIYEGQTYNFLVRFIKDKDGIWRISFF